MDFLNANNNCNCRQVPLTCNGHTRPIVNLHFSYGDKSKFYLISASKDGLPMLRYGSTGDWIGTFNGHKGAVWGVVLNKFGTRAATGSADFTAKIWNAQTGEELHSLIHNHIVKSVDFSSDEMSLLTGSNEKLIRLFDLNNIDSSPFKFAGHTDSIRHVAFSDLNDQKFVSASEDKTVRFWDRRSPSSIHQLQFDQTPISIEVTTDKTVLTICYGDRVAFYNLNTLDKMKEIIVPTQVYTSSLHPDKNVFVCGGEDFHIYKYDYHTQQQLDSYTEHFGAVHCIRYSPDGEVYASGSEDGTLRLWLNTPGKSYGLWKFVENSPSMEMNE